MKKLKAISKYRGKTMGRIAFVDECDANKWGVVFSDTELSYHGTLDHDAVDAMAEALHEYLNEQEKPDADQG